MTSWKSTLHVGSMTEMKFKKA